MSTRWVTNCLCTASPKCDFLAILSFSVNTPDLVNTPALGKVSLFDELYLLEWWVCTSRGPRSSACLRWGSWRSKPWWCGAQSHRAAADTWTEVVVDSIRLRVLGRWPVRWARPSSWQGSDARPSSCLPQGSDGLPPDARPPIHRTVGVRHVELGLDSIEIPIKMTKSRLIGVVPQCISRENMMLLVQRLGLFWQISAKAVLR